MTPEYTDEFTFKHYVQAALIVMVALGLGYLGMYALMVGF